MAGFKVVPVKTHENGTLDLEDLKEKAEKYRHNLAAFMVGLFRHLVRPRSLNHLLFADYLPIDVWCFRRRCSDGGYRFIIVLPSPCD